MNFDKQFTLGYFKFREPAVNFSKKYLDFLSFAMKEQSVVSIVLTGATVCLVLCTALLFGATTKTGEILSKTPFMLAGFTTLSTALATIILLVELRLSETYSTVQGKLLFP